LYVLCFMFILCSLYAPIHQNKFQVGVNLLGNKYDSDLILKKLCKKTRCTNTI